MGLTEDEALESAVSDATAQGFAADQRIASWTEPIRNLAGEPERWKAVIVYEIDA